MTLASFGTEPREDHLDRARRVVSYLVKFKHDKSEFAPRNQIHALCPSLHLIGKSQFVAKLPRFFPEDDPEPKGKYVMTVGYHYANLRHNVVAGRSVAGVIHFLNKTPMDWHSKKKATVEKAACGSECSSD